MAAPRIAVVGGGLAGLMAAIRIAEAEGLAAHANALRRRLEGVE